MSQFNPIWAAEFTLRSLLLLINSSARRKETCIGWFACSLCKTGLSEGLWAMNFYWASFTGLSKWKTAFWNSQGQLPQQTASPLSGKKCLKCSETGDEADWWFLVSFIDSCCTSVSSVTLRGHLACLPISSNFHVNLCQQSGNFNDEHVCHFYHSIEAVKMMFKFSLIDESCSDSQGQGSNIHRYGFSKKSRNLIFLSEDLFFHLQGVWNNHAKSFVAARLCSRGNPKVIKFEEQYFNHQHRIAYNLFVGNERHTFSVNIMGSWRSLIKNCPKRLATYYWTFPI